MSWKKSCFFFHYQHEWQNLKTVFNRNCFFLFLKFDFLLDRLTVSLVLFKNSLTYYCLWKMLGWGSFQCLWTSSQKCNANEKKKKKKNGKKRSMEKLWGTYTELINNAILLRWCSYYVILKISIWVYNLTVNKTVRSVNIAKYLFSNINRSKVRSYFCFLQCLRFFGGLILIIILIYTKCVN